MLRVLDEDCEQVVAAHNRHRPIYQEVLGRMCRKLAALTHKTACPCMPCKDDRARKAARRRESRRERDRERAALARAEKEKEAEKGKGKGGKGDKERDKKGEKGEKGGKDKGEKGEKRQRGTSRGASSKKEDDCGEVSEKGTAENGVKGDKEKENRPNAMWEVWAREKEDARRNRASTREDLDGFDLDAR